MLLMAVDGGATTTRVVIADETGRILVSGRAGPSNHLHGKAGERRLRKALRRAISGALDVLAIPSAPAVAAACLGMTGVGREPWQCQLVEAATQEIVRCERIRVEPDWVTAFAGASVDGFGVLVYAGTGTVSYGRDASGRTARAGGLGYLIDDEGGAYHIGRAALKAVFRARDGRAPPTILERYIIRHFRATDLAGVRRAVYRGDGLKRPAMGRLARVVSEAAEAGDVAAREILAAAAHELATLGVTVARELNWGAGPVPVYWSGGVFAAGRWILEPFARAVGEMLPGAEVHPPRFPPVVGCLLLAFEASAIPVDAGVLQRIAAGATG